MVAKANYIDPFTHTSANNALISSLYMNQLGLLTFSGRHQKVNLLLPLIRPHLNDGLSQLQVCLVHLFCGPHLDAQVLPGEGKEGFRSVIILVALPSDHMYVLCGGITYL
jgi:hypothetical protein